jgi:hypothetical protein
MFILVLFSYITPFSASFGLAIAARRTDGTTVPPLDSADISAKPRSRIKFYLETN